MILAEVDVYSLAILLVGGGGIGGAIYKILTVKPSNQASAIAAAEQALNMGSKAAADRVLAADERIKAIEDEAAAAKEAAKEAAETARRMGERLQQLEERAAVREAALRRQLDEVTADRDKWRSTAQRLERLLHQGPAGDTGPAAG